MNHVLKSYKPNTKSEILKTQDQCFLSLTKPKTIEKICLSEYK